jgi:CBS domain-containing membrane protein
MMPRFPLAPARLRAALRPPQGPTAWPVALRTGLGCGLALLVAGAMIAASGLPAATGLMLIAPLGASALLVIGVPNSPLAQPWAVLVGNLAAALLGVIIAMAVPWPILAAALALAAAVAVMLLARALHPPAGAVALVPVLSPDLVDGLGLWFVLAPVATDSLILLAFALVWHRITGRVYPFRQPDEAPRAAARFSRADLAAILSRLRLAQNIGVADYARLLAAADEVRRADDRTEGLRCADAAGAPPPVLSPDQPLAQARAALLAGHSYTLPVAGPDGRLAGVLSQSDVLRATDTQASTVAEVMTPRPVSLPADAPLRQALAVLARGGWRAVPLTDAQGRVAGMLTRADLIAVLARPGHAPLPDRPEPAKPPP